MESVSTAIEFAEATKAEERKFLDMMMTEKWVSIKTTAEYLGINQDTLRRYAGLRDGAQPCLDEGTHWQRMTKKGTLFFRIGPTEQRLKNQAVVHGDDIINRMAEARDRKGTAAPAA